MLTLAFAGGRMAGWWHSAQGRALMQINNTSREFGICQEQHDT
jgi:hypothetical protein